MKKLIGITFEWEITDTRTGGFRTGITKFATHAKNKIEAINDAISFATHLPSAEIERNGIDLEEYREYPVCSYYYETRLTKILKVGNLD